MLIDRNIDFKVWYEAKKLGIGGELCSTSTPKRLKTMSTSADLEIGT